MSVSKDPNGSWKASCRYKDWQGNTKQKLKRGFKTKKLALEWEREFLQKSHADLGMSFESFVEIYYQDMRERIRENTWRTKKAIIEKKILPYFRTKKMEDIKPTDVMAWQNEMLSMTDKHGKKHSPSYLKSVHNQLSCLFNHALRYYELPSNPAKKAGNMGKGKSKEMMFWTKEEYQQFAEAMMDKPISFYAFEILYWCGIRCGELLALTTEDFDFEKKTLRINKSYQRFSGRDVITDPKTPKSNRIISMPDFLSEEILEYTNSFYDLALTDRIFPISKGYLHNEMKRGSKVTGVKQVRVHDLRHSHVSLLIDRGFSAVAIADRVGHESIDITFRYAHLFPSKQTEIADKLNEEREDNYV